LATQGSAALVAQEAWIRNKSVKDNILCGKTFDGKQYAEVIRSTALQPDIDIFVAGDDTEIGEKVLLPAF
jgi:ABC-type transport system involved in cytochrome bd biosynthesis fused ATPase/permease subunit